VFAKERVDACICLGDLTDHAPDDTKNDVVSCFFEALNLIRSYRIPFYLIPGNHDYIMMTGDELLVAEIQTLPYAISIGGYRLILLDANYRSDGRRFDVSGVEWTDSNLPKQQCEFLKSELRDATCDCIVCIHENLDPFVEARHLVKNAEEIRRIIRESGKVKLVLQGHYHPGAERTVDGILYLTLPAMCEGDDNSYRILTLP
ncbi:MAG: metallophosphoesterase, partial [Clostridia bacterium]|nr:metallophosphoesterase [Clostridia bacterium]